jgi:hypothetical protein
MKGRHWLLILLLFISEIKAIFYDSDIRFYWLLNPEHSRLLCNILKDISTSIIIIVLCFFALRSAKDNIERFIVSSYITLSFLDLIHLAINDMQGFVLLKIALALGINKIIGKYY